MMVSKKTPKNAMKFYCKCCDFGTGKRSEYNRHLLTAKHKMVSNGIKKTPKNDPYMCECGKEYMNSSGLSRHKRKCDYETNILDKDPKEDNVVTDNQERDNVVTDNHERDNVDYKKMFMTLVKQKDSEIMTLVKQNNKFMKQNSKLVETITEMAPKVGNNNNNINNNNFNINIFLNEQCKDAISMDKFIQGIEISMKNLLTTKDKGLAEGISNIFIENMSKLSLHERPLHCTDTKRETLYIKNDEWEKDQDNKQIKEKMRNVAQKQVRSLNKWTEEHPNYMNVSHLQDEYTKLVQGISDTLDHNEGKVLKKVCNNVYLSDKGESVAIE
jgi:hypothetical protein